MRYEAAVETNLTFHTREPPYPLSDFPEPETVVIVYEGLRFVWHAVGPDEDGEARWPVVTTMVTDPDNYEDEQLATARFLSALSYATSQRIRVVLIGGAGDKQEMDTPLLSARRRGLADHVYAAPTEVVAVDDDRLRIVLGHYREGLSAGSPFFEFLAFWNALDVACEDVNGRLRGWIRQHAGQYAHLRGADAAIPDDWWGYLQNERRSAVAHAIRGPEWGPDLDPDDPADRSALAGDARLLDQLVQVRVGERWGDHAVWLRQREAVS